MKGIVNLDDWSIIIKCIATRRRERRGRPTLQPCSPPLYKEFIKIVFLSPSPLLDCPHRLWLPNWHPDHHVHSMTQTEYFCKKICLRSENLPEIEIDSEKLRKFLVWNSIINWNISDIRSFLAQIILISVLQKLSQLVN